MSTEGTDDMNSRNTNKKPRIQGFAWLFTLNNYTNEDILSITDPVKSQKYQYIFQEEKGEMGTEHLQGYLKYHKKVSFNEVKKLMPKAHIEQAKNKYACMNYCKKAETRNGKIYKNFEPEVVIKQQYVSLEDQKKEAWEQIRREIADEIKQGKYDDVKWFA